MNEDERKINSVGIFAEPSKICQRETENEIGVRERRLIEQSVVRGASLRYIEGRLRVLAGPRNGGKVLAPEPVSSGLSGLLDLRSAWMPMCTIRHGFNPHASLGNACHHAHPHRFENPSVMLPIDLRGTYPFVMEVGPSRTPR
jgi:hypothetical protein